MQTKELTGLTGAQIFKRLLTFHDVQHIFGYPGGAALPLFDSIFKTNLEFILSRHEQGAGHMAEGYARASGKPGIVLVTSGPGTSNVVTPMLDALLDGTPMIVFCGQVSTTVQGTNAFQEIDVMALAKSCTKWCTCLQSVEDLPRAVERAFHMATHNRPGPVLVAIPKDVSQAIFRSSETNRIMPLESRPSPQLDDVIHHHDTIDRIASLVNKAEKPVICAGQGVITSRNGSDLLARLVDKARIPVTTTLLGLGCFDETREEALHMLGTHGTPYANLAIQNADLILVLGARLDERAVANASGFAPVARKAQANRRGGIFQFDISPDSVGKVVSPTDTVYGDLSDTLPLLLSRIEHKQRASWLHRIYHWKQTYKNTVPSSSGGCLPQQIVAEIDRQTRALGESTTITTGVGQHQMWTARYFQFHRPRSMITSGGLGTMGFGLPAAIGAKIAQPTHQVINLDGDASLCMSVQELLTAVEHNVKVKTVVFSNQKQEMIVQLQRLHHGGRVCYSAQRNPDFVALATSMGCRGLVCANAKELPGCVQWLLQCDGPALLEVVTEDAAMVPRVKTGEALDCMVLS